LQAFPSKKKKKMQASSFQNKKKKMHRAIFAKMFRTIEHFSINNLVILDLLIREIS